LTNTSDDYFLHSTGVEQPRLSQALKIKTAQRGLSSILDIANSLSISFYPSQQGVSIRFTEPSGNCCDVGSSWFRLVQQFCQFDYECFDYFN
jgi:hypothetical protein